MQLLARGRIEDRAGADRPDVLDGVDAGLGRADGIHAVCGDRHAEPVRLLDDDGDEVERKELVELDDVAADLVLAPHGLARFLGGGDDDVAARGPAVGRVGRHARAADGAARHPDARAPDLAELGAALLRQRPGAILEDLDGHAGGDAEMEIELAVEVLQVRVAVDEARQDRQAGGVDHLRAVGNAHIALRPDGLEAAFLR